MQDLPSDILGALATFCPVSSCWSLSRTCKHAYLSINKKIYSIFEKQFLREVFWKEFQHNLYIDFFLEKLEVTTYVYSGSLVWSTLLGVNWENQDIDIFSSDIVGSFNHNSWLLTTPNKTKFAIGYSGYAVSGYIYPLVTLKVRSDGRSLLLKFADIISCGGKSIHNRINEFDMVGCSNYFDPNGKILYIADAKNTLFKRTEKRLVDGNTPTFERMGKYAARGITFI